jgi:D-glycero-alpha-D-manno-heptose 1-phosphate guanylyltransferase
MSQGMRLLVLAGGFGTRLHSVVAVVPKALAPVGDVPFLYLQLDHWIAQGLRSFVFLLHHQADLVIRFLEEEQDGLLKGCEVQWIVEPAPMDTGGAVAYAVEQLGLTGDFLVTNADTWLGTGVQDVCQADAPTIAVIEISDAGRYGRVQLDDENHVTAFQEKSSSKGSGWINTGLCHLNAELFKDWNHRPYSLERTSFPAIAARHVLKAVVLHTDFIDIGIPEDYFRFCRWIESGKKVGL